MGSLIRKFVGRMLKAAYRLLGWAIPSPIRNELLAYARYRRGSRARVAYIRPYWERREQSGVAKGLVRIGFVGAGTYAQNHLKVLANLEQVEIASLLTTGGPRVYEVAPKYGITRIFTDIDDFVAQEDVDCFVVVVPTRYTRSVALTCLRVGKPVLMEKPAGVSSAETAELVRQAEESNTFGMVCMNRRFYSVIEHGLAQLASCGPLRGAMLEMPLAISAERQSGRLTEWDYDHFLVRNSIHGIDLLRYILGDPVKVHSLAWPNEEFKNAAASFASLWEYDRGMVATITDLWDTPPVWRLKVVAEQGWIEFEPLEQGWFAHKEGKKLQIRSDPIDRQYRMGVYAQDLHFVQAVRQGKRPSLPACLLPDAYRTMLLVEQILDSSLSRGILSGSGV